MSDFKSDVFARILRDKRGPKTIRDISAEMGNVVSPSAISRLENGGMPNLETFMVVCKWLKTPPALFFDSSLAQGSTLISATMSIPEIIEFYLKMDGRLSLEISSAVVDLVRAVYKELA